MHEKTLTDRETTTAAGGHESLELPEETQTRLRIGRTKYHELIELGELESVKIGSRRMVLRSSTDAFIERLRTAA